jgi:DNA-binding protein HU-beta
MPSRGASPFCGIFFCLSDGKPFGKGQTGLDFDARLCKRTDWDTGKPTINFATETAMTKAELVQKIHAKSGLATKTQAEAALDALVSILTEAMKAGDSVTFTGFGSFKVTERAARKGRNPRTGKEIDIPAGKAVKFTPGKALKDAVK